MRASWDSYYMELAHTVAMRADCLRRECGALLIADNHIFSTGYNGTPSGVRNCTEGGCARCASTSIPSGQRHEECLCVHAETNAVVLAARHGDRTDGATMYATVQPCLACLKLSIQAGIARIVYDTSDATPGGIATPDYAKLIRESGIQCSLIEQQKAG